MTRFAAREVLVLVTADDCSGRSNSEKERVLMELSVLIAEKPGLAQKASKMSELLWEKPFQDQDLVNLLGF